MESTVKIQSTARALHSLSRHTGSVILFATAHGELSRVDAGVLAATLGREAAEEMWIGGAVVISAAAGDAAAVEALRDAMAQLNSADRESGPPIEAFLFDRGEIRGWTVCAGQRAAAPAIRQHA